VLDRSWIDMLGPDWCGTVATQTGYRRDGMPSTTSDPQLPTAHPRFRMEAQPCSKANGAAR
jgi:hypothetical protein